MLKKSVFLIGTRWFAVLGPCRLLIERLAQEGYDVYVIGARDDHYGQFVSHNVTLIEANFKRSYLSPISDLTDLFKLCCLALKVKPRFIHSFNPKPSIFAAVVALVCGATFFVGVTGLGNTFIKGGFKAALLAKIMRSLYSNARYVFFQNDDDVEFFRKNILKDPGKILKFTSPGVDVDRFRVRQAKRTGKLRVITVARMLWQKGIDDFIATVRAVRAQGLEDKFEFTIVGPQDNDHPDRLHESDIKELPALGINWTDWTADIETFYASNHVLLFMSHREGAPRAILEASATGLPTVGANTIGVRELVRDGKTGFLVELHDIQAILEKLVLYSNDEELRTMHGEAARRIIAEPLSLQNATDAQYEMYCSRE